MKALLHIYRLVRAGRTFARHNVVPALHLAELPAPARLAHTILGFGGTSGDMQPGDVLVKLDSSSLETQLMNQQIVCANSKAVVIQAQNVYDTAVIAKREYLEGQYKLDRQTFEHKIIVAEENLRRAVDYLKYSERLAAKGYVTAAQLEGDIGILWQQIAAIGVLGAIPITLIIIFFQRYLVRGFSFGILK